MEEVKTALAALKYYFDQNSCIYYKYVVLYGCIYKRLQAILLILVADRRELKQKAMRINLSHTIAAYHWLADLPGRAWLDS